MNPNASVYDRGVLPRTKNGCGPGQGCGVVSGNDTGSRVGVDYGNGQKIGNGNDSADPDPPPPPPGLKKTLQPKNKFH